LSLTGSKSGSVRRVSLDEHVGMIDMSYNTTTNLLSALLPLSVAIGVDSRPHSRPEGGVLRNPLSVANGADDLEPLRGLLTALQPADGRDLVENIEGALASFRPRLVSLLNSLPWDTVDYYINQRGRPSQDVSQEGVKKERIRVSKAASELVRTYHRLSTEVFDVEMLAAACPFILAAPDLDTLLRDTATLGQATSSGGSQLGQQQAHMMPLQGAEHTEVIVISDDEDDPMDMDMDMEIEDDVDWEHAFDF
jgi:hypothetical protein